MSIKSIYERLTGAGMSAAGACGLMGNMQAESGMKSSIVQRGMTELSDAEYTRRADCGELDFAHDGVGYGLVQWTFGPRKEKLLGFARAAGVSVGDEDMQVKFCISELRADFPGLWSFLCTAESVYGAAARVCTEYERPAVNNIAARAAHAQKYYDLLGGARRAAEDGAEKPEYWPPRMLCEGMSGADVLAAQALLLARGRIGETDAFFSGSMSEAVAGFQRSCGLAADGVIGPLTWAALLATARTSRCRTPSGATTRPNAQALSLSNRFMTWRTLRAYCVRCGLARTMSRSRSTTA